MNSTALLIGMYQRDIPIDLILFADTGGEKPDTYDYITVMNGWLSRHGLPEIQVVEYTDKNGNRLTLEEECLRSESLPSLAYGFKKCSLKHKISTQDKFMNHFPGTKEIWKSGEKITKFIGFDTGERRRQKNALKYDVKDKKYMKAYALIDWGIDRQCCIDMIRDEGLPVPVKSACFFCPASKKHEVQSLSKRYPDLFKRATEIEKLAKSHLHTIKGLGRDWDWESFIRLNDTQLSLFDEYRELETNNSFSNAHGYSCFDCYQSYD
ncbi:hypothetical protein LJC32_03720 [Oscillospiraceae bacterium OttesenSCG-928-F05]|nr:hypothetical protein [Oscillospiraceae bacterium OttesenSCG-928-F05]